MLGWFARFSPAFAMRIMRAPLYLRIFLWISRSVSLIYRLNYVQVVCLNIWVPSCEVYYQEKIKFTSIQTFYYFNEGFYSSFTKVLKSIFFVAYIWNSLSFISKSLCTFIHFYMRTVRICYTFAHHKHSNHLAGNARFSLYSQQVLLKMFEFWTH